MKLKRLIDEPTINKDKETCKGRIYRCSTHNYISKYKSIEVRKSLRLLKKSSCPGCAECGWMDQVLQDEIEGDCYNDFLSGLINGNKYKLIGKWIPGSYEYPEEGELEIKFQKVK